MSRKFLLPSRFDFEIVFLLSAGIVSASILLATLLALVSGHQVDKEVKERSKAITLHLAQEVAAPLHNQHLSEVRAHLTHLFGERAVVAIRITDANHNIVVEEAVGSFKPSPRLALPPMFGRGDSQVVVADDAHAFRFSAPIYQATVEVPRAAPTIIGYANVYLDKTPFSASKVDAFVSNIITAIIVAAALSLFLGWVTWHRLRNTRLLFDMIGGKEPSFWDLGAAASGQPEVYRVIKEYQAAVASMSERERSLRKARDDAVGTAVAKAHFAATVSHEVRTPLNGIVGMLNMLEQSNLTPIQREQVNIAWNSAESLMRLLDTILDFSRIEAGKSKINESDFDVHHFVSDVARIFFEQARQKGVELSWHIGADVPVHVVADPIRLRQVLTNILDNAVKFTDTGSIVLSVVREKDDSAPPMLRFTVTDTGLGISTAGRERVFESYTRENQNRRLGTGLGLAIAREVVGMMGGKIGVSSEEGKGSTFWFTIAYRADADAMRKPLDFEFTQADVGSSGQPRPSLTGLHVLIVDDNRTNLQVAKQMLTLLGAETICCDNGAEAVALVRCEEFDCILMDCNMPVMNGYDATKAIREIEAANPGRKPARILAVSAFNSDNNRHRCEQAGMDGLLPKPITIARIQSAMLPVMDIPEGQKPLEGSTSDGDQIIDVSVLDQLRDIIGPGIADAINPFLEDVPIYLRDLDAAVKAGDQERAAAIIHTVKGCSIGLGVLRLHHLARSAEDLARQRDLAGVAQLLSPMQEAFEAAKPTLQEFASPK